jgi:IS4 transposase
MYTTYSHKSPHRPPTQPPPPPFSPAQLLRFFVQLLPRAALLRLPALNNRPFYHRLFTPIVTLWYLLFQRLNFDHSLQAALSDARSGGADRLNHKLSRGLRSPSTCSYSDSRQRLPWQFLLQALGLQATQLIGLSPTTLWQGWVLALLDGTTVRLRPYGDIPQQFPPHRNQHRRPYWSLMRVVVGFCALSGAALDCAVGSLGVSEQALACQLILASTAKSLFIADRNFGIFRIAQVARHAGQAVLLRMTEIRARKVLGRRLGLGQHEVLWKPTRHDQLQEGCSQEGLAGRLLVVRLQRPGFRSKRLCLFTTLPNTAQYCLTELVRLYGLRWHIELNLRYLKTQMDLVQLEARSADMARKEWLAGLLAYNLIRGAQLCAALHKGSSPLSLSFSGVRRCLEIWLRQVGHTRQRAYAQWGQLLESMGQCLLARRRKARPSEPRAQRHLRLPYKALYGSRAQARRQLKKYASKS